MNEVSNSLMLEESLETRLSVLSDLNTKIGLPPSTPPGTIIPGAEQMIITDENNLFKIISVAERLSQQENKIMPRLATGQITQSANMIPPISSTMLGTMFKS